ncbi:hypothetical protein LTR37_004005 [Vermiconidia calcicola]|uniref:Uncharacterized protein n=1 Tax=Vermiconidia calcicola TaxID=1690605 RepID=A0ACC3NNH9_9PEZI|nr:hypothetical protein LTR37_004005 [Vermiconidia calcicola]
MATIQHLLLLGLATIHANAQGGGGMPLDGQPPTGPPIHSGPWRGEGQTAGSPPLALFENKLPIPAIAKPEFSEEIDGRTVDFYSMTIENFDKQIYPDLNPSHMVGYNGMAPGPTFFVDRGRETIIRYLNKGNQISAVHLHGSATHAVWDGWAEDDIGPGQWKDYYYPNYESGRSMWYHDHVHGHTATNAYMGQAGAYILHDAAEDALGLPSGDYDVPLAIADKKYQSNGELVSPEGETQNFYGDIIHVNDQPWPYHAVEPRKYRFRVYCMSLSRPYNLWFQDASGQSIEFQIIGSDAGLFGSPVSSSDLTISMGERYEIAIDFAAFAGQNITLSNALQIPIIEEYENTDKVMRFVVGSSVSDSSNNDGVPSTLNPDVNWPEQKDNVDHVFTFQQGGDGGAQWSVNGLDWEDVNNRILAKPPQGATELWELRH